MKPSKLITSMLVMLLLVASVALADKPLEPKKVGSIDVECQAKGFDFGIVKYEWNNNAFVPEDPAIVPYTITVTGTDSQANWTANPSVDGVINKQGQDYVIENGGTQGIANQGQHAISHLTFCGDEDEVPEFGLIASMFVVAGAGLFIFKRRN